MRNTRNWKHTTKRSRQYKTIDFAYGYFDPYYDPMSYIGRSKKDTPFMDTSDIEDDEE